MRKTIILLSVTTLVCGASAAYFWQALDRSEQRVFALQAQLTALAKSTPRELPSTPDATPLTPATTPAPPEIANPPPAPTTTREAAMARARRAAFVDQSRLLKDPDYRAAMLAHNKLAIMRNYSDLGAALRLPPEQLDAFFSLLAEQQLPTADRLQFFSRMAPDTQPDAATAEALQRKLQEDQRRKEAEIRSLLGEAKLQEWNDYQASLPARHQVRQLRTLLEDTATPLKSEQVTALVATIASEQRKLAGQSTQSPRAAAPRAADSTSLMEQGLEQMQAYNQRLQDATAAYLTPEQNKLFEQMLDGQLEMQRQSIKLMRAQAAAREEAGVAPPATSNNGALVTLGPDAMIVPIVDAPRVDATRVDAPSAKE